MKKTLLSAALLALAGVAAAGDTWETKTLSFSFSEAATDANNPSVIDLGTSIDLSKAWSLTFEAYTNYNNSSNYWGSTLLASGQNAIADGYSGGFQVYHTSGGEGVTNPKGINMKLNSGNTTQVPAGDLNLPGLIKVQLAYDGSGTLTYTLTTTGQNTTEGDSPQTVTGSVSTTYAESALLTHLSTNITSEMLGDKGWTLPSGTITYTALVVPEPATATLSLLALVGLCARRRRK